MPRYGKIVPARELNATRAAGADGDSGLLLATEPLGTMTGRVTYSQQIFEEFGWIESAKDIGVDFRDSGWSPV